MKILSFRSRWLSQWQQFAKYLRYVFNDHAIIALLILLGAGMVGYQQILVSIQIGFWTKGLALILVGLTFSIFWRGASFILPADPVYLLAAENRLRKILRQATVYSIIINMLVQFLIMLVLTPLLAKLFGISATMIIIIISIGIKGLITLGNMQYMQRFKESAQGRQGQANKLVNWHQLVVSERNRQQKILAFFNMFIDVPGMQARVKRRAWADPLLAFFEPRQSTTISKIMVRTFVRQTQYLSVWLRITLFGGVLIFLSTGWLQLGLLIVLVYLMIIQWYPLVKAQQNVVFDHVYPIKLAERRRAFISITSKFAGLTVVFWLILVLYLGMPIINALTGLLIIVVFIGVFEYWQLRQLTMTKGQLQRGA